MPVFVNYNKKYFLFVSYKVGYSTFLSQKNLGLRYLHVFINLPVFKHLIKYLHFERILVMRHPYNRFISLFSDKYRKQPLRVMKGLHTWENAHKCLYKHLEINDGMTDKEIASKFLTLEISTLIALLPEIIEEDAHFWPQSYLRNFSLFNIKMPINYVFQIERDAARIRDLTNVDLGVIKNKSDSDKFELSLNDKEKLSKIYKSDFELGGYNHDVL